MAIPSTGRFCGPTIEQHFQTAKADNVGETVSAHLSLEAVPGDKSLVFTAQVEIKSNGVSLAVYDVAAETTGAEAKFRDVDAAIKLVNSIIPSSTGVYSVSVNVGTVLDKNPPMDLIKAAQSEITQLAGKKTKAQAKIADHDAQLALMVDWENGNALQAARKAETQLQKATLQAMVASFDAETARLQALITP